MLRQASTIQNNGEISLIEAIEQDNLAAVKAILKKEKNKKFFLNLPENKSCLYEAVKWHRVEIAKLLYSFGADAEYVVTAARNFKNLSFKQHIVEQDHTAFDLALFRKDWTLVQLLLKNEADPEYISKCKKALFLAVGEVKAYKTTVDDFILHFDSDILRLSDDKGNTILHHIAVRGNVELIEMLIDRDNLSIKRKNNEGVTPFLAAAKAKQWKLIKELITLRSPSERLTSDSDAAIHYAILDNRLDMVEYLSVDFVIQIIAKEERLHLGEERFDINTEHLITAVKNNQPAALSYLCKRVKVCKSAENAPFYTPIHLAAMLKHWGCVLVLAKHYNPTPTSGHLDALVSAIEENQIEVVIALLEKGCLDCLVSSNHIISIDSLLDKVKLTGNHLLKKLIKGMLKAKDQSARQKIIDEIKNSITNTKVALIELLRSSSRALQDRDESQALNIAHLPIEIMDLIVERVANENGIKNPPRVRIADRAYLNLVKTFCIKQFSFINSMALFKKTKMAGAARQSLIEELQCVLHKNSSVKNKVIELKEVINDFVKEKGQKNGRTLRLLDKYELIETTPIYVSGKDEDEDELDDFIHIKSPSNDASSNKM